MKWADIRSRSAETSSTETPSGSPDRRNMFFNIVALIIIIGIASALWYFLVFKKRTPASLLPPEQMREVVEFLEQNPPAPVLPETAQMIMDTVDQPVAFDDIDTQQLLEFFNR